MSARRLPATIAWLAVVAALLTGACATSTHTVVLSDEERCLRYGGLWLPSLGQCSHTSSVGR